MLLLWSIFTPRAWCCHLETSFCRRRFPHSAAAFRDRPGLSIRLLFDCACIMQRTCGECIFSLINFLNCATTGVSTRTCGELLFEGLSLLRHINTVYISIAYYISYLDLSCCQFKHLLLLRHQLMIYSHLLSLLFGDTSKT